MMIDIWQSGSSDGYVPLESIAPTIESSSAYSSAARIHLPLVEAEVVQFIIHAVCQRFISGLAGMEGVGHSIPVDPDIAVL